MSETKTLAERQAELDALIQKTEDLHAKILADGIAAKAKIQERREKSLTNSKQS